MKHLSFAICGILCLSLATPAAAHHSASRFDFGIRDKTYEGVVTEFRVRNPHTVIVIEVTDEKGTREVEFEGHSRNNYFRSGWREGMVEVGDRITVMVAPRRDGEDGGYALGVITEDGTQF